MTIAAGFLHRDGVLLCADSLQETPNLKFHGPKVGHFDCHGGTVGYAFAGNSDFAAAAIQGLERRLNEISSGEPIKVAEKFLDKEYRRVVFGNPNQAYDIAVHYWFLLAFRLFDAPVELYATNQTSMRRISTYECIGMGDALAKHLTRSTFGTGMSERRVLYLAANTLAIVERDVPGCDGPSKFLSIRNDATVKEINDDPVVSQIETYSPAYQMISQQLFWSMMDVAGVRDSDFEKNLALFNSRVLQKRKELSAAWEQRLAEFRQLNPDCEGPDPREI